MKKKILTEIQKITQHNEKIVLFLTDIHGSLEKILPEIPPQAKAAPLSHEAATAAIRAIDSYTETELVTIKEARHMLGVSRWKIAELRKENKLTTLEKNNQIRLIRTEVEAAKKWYSIPHGKI